MDASESKKVEKPLSFVFSRKKERINLLSGEGELNRNDFIASLEEKSIKSVKSKEEIEKDIIIPLIKENRWKKVDKTHDSTMRSIHNEHDTSIDAQAARELIEEAAQIEDDRKSKPYSKYQDIEIPLLLRNKVPDGFETDELLDVSLRPNEATNTNYDEIPIESFGRAMLRGMGWSEGKAFGRSKDIVTPLDPILRPKGLGLGATQGHRTQNSLQEKSMDSNQEKLEMKKGATCVVTAGRHKDLYGLIEGLDEDNARAVVKLALSKESVTLSQMAIQLTTKKEYEKSSKYLNKGKAERYKEKEKKRLMDADENDIGVQNHSYQHKGQKNQIHKQDKYFHKHQNDRKRKHDEQFPLSRIKDICSEKVHASTENDLTVTLPWLRPHLRVRIVDPEYKKGKYYKLKVVIEDVITQMECICRTDEGKVLDNIKQSMLETVIPRGTHSYVMILAKKHIGQIGELLEKNKAACKATVQLLSDRDKLIHIDFDDICEYTGDISHVYDY